MTGYKGWTGFAITLLGSFGVFEYMGVTQDEFSKFIDNIVQVVGFILAVWGYVDAKLRMKKAGMHTDVVTKAIAKAI